MARLDVAGDELILHVGPFERLGGFVRGDAHIPLTAVRGARAVANPWKKLRGIRSPGTGWPRGIALGTWRFSGGKDFVAVYGRRKPAVIVDLVGVDFARLIVTTPDAEAVAEKISRAARSPLSRPQA